MATLPPRPVGEDKGSNQKGKRAGFPFVLNSGAGEESRTLDLNLGKVALYQLSYSRNDKSNYSVVFLLPWNSNKNTF